MKVNMCKVFDPTVGEWIDIGVFSTLAKAMEAGSLYIIDACEGAALLDWDHDPNVYTDWFQGKTGAIFTRVITECEVDRTL